MKLNRFMLPIIAGLTVAACSETAPVDSSQTEGSPIVLSARTDEGGSVNTRVSDEPVESGSYYLSFTNTNEDLQTVSAPFRDGTGYPWVDGAGEDGEGEALHWGYIQRPVGDNVTLYLDNVAGETTDNVVEWDDNDNVYQASVYNAATSENDIVWGRKTDVEYNATNVNFTLSHRMACVRVNIQVDVNDGGDADVSESITRHGVTVSLLDVRYKASQFNRTTGNVSENTTKTKDEEIHDGTLLEGGYTSTWIFPPQSFNDSYRPILQIKLKDGSGTTYEGGLPESMFDGNGSYSGNLAFSAGQLLTINVKLVTSIADREILFLPAVVENWTHLDPIDIISRQLGIYSEEDYAAVVNAYNNQEGGIDTETMARYATYDEETNKWIVNIFAEIGTDEELTDDNKFNNNTSITLVFNGWTVYGKDANSQSDLFASYDSGETEGGEGTGGDEGGEAESGGDENTDDEN